METDLTDHLSPNGALGKIAALAQKWERRARRAERANAVRIVVAFCVGAGAAALAFFVGT